MELFIDILNCSVSKDMIERNIHIRLWDYCVERCDDVHNLTSMNTCKVQGLTPHAAVTGEQ